MYSWFEKAYYTVVKGIEGEYSNDPDDPGGETRWGIAKNMHPGLWEAGAPTDAEAVRFYRDLWDKLHCSELKSYWIALELFECAILCGPKTAVLIMQEAYNDVRPADSDHLVEDGVIGPKTLAAVNKFTARKPVWERALYNTMNNGQGTYLRSRHRRQFIRGWMDKRIDTLKEEEQQCKNF